MNKQNVRYVQANKEAGTRPHSSWLNHVSELDVEMKKSIAFLGPYGRGNFGDDLFGYVLQRLCEHLSDIEPMIVAALGPRELAAAWYPGCLRKWLSHKGVAGTGARVIRYIAAIAKADSIVFARRSLSDRRASLPFLHVLSGVARLLGKPIHALGVSEGPFSASVQERKFLCVVNRLNSTAVRNTGSVHRVLPAREASLHLGDLAFMLPSVYEPKVVKKDKRTLVIALHLTEYIDATLAMLEAALSLALIDAVSIVALDPESKPICDEVARRVAEIDVPVERFTYGPSILDIVDVFASARLVVSSKLDGVITSYVYDVPVLLFCYEDKCCRFLDDAELPGPREAMPEVSTCVETACTLLENAARRSAAPGRDSAEFRCLN